jgi:4'-phosphopantetheinyl transferase
VSIVTGPGWLARGEHQVPAGGCWLAPAEATRAAGMRFTKRRAEYLTRRWAANVAVAHRLGLPTDPASLARVEVTNAVGGAPRAYLDGRTAGVEVSLTDRAGWAVCLVWTEPRPVGCDLELAEPRSRAFVRDFFTEAERRAVAGAGRAAGPREVANLIWSAKESAVKLLRNGPPQPTSRPRPARAVSQVRTAPPGRPASAVAPAAFRPR